MEDRNCELLFEYLRSILYDSEVKPLEIDSLDEPFQKLGMGLQYLETAVREMKQCSAALSKGDLSSFKPARVFCTVTGDRRMKYGTGMFISSGSVRLSRKRRRITDERNCMNGSGKQKILITDFMPLLPAR